MGIAIAFAIGGAAVAAFGALIALALPPVGAFIAGVGVGTEIGASIGAAAIEIGGGLFIGQAANYLYQEDGDVPIAS
jgi:hypothetical protein